MLQLIFTLQVINYCKLERYMQASINILGQCSFRKDDQLGQTRELLPANRPLLLCTYLATQESWVNRDVLLTLFWPDDTESKARNKLRQLLHITKKEIYAEFIEVEESRLKLNLNSDFQAFQAAFEAGDWSTALEHYKDELLVGQSAKNMPNYQDWLELTRHELSDMWREASINHAQNLAEQKHYTSANRYLKALLKKDLLAEDVLHLYLGYCMKAGQRKEGLEIAEQFKTMLMQELQMEPLTQTTELIEELRALKEVDTPKTLEEVDSSVVPTLASESLKEQATETKPTQNEPTQNEPTENTAQPSQEKQEKNVLKLPSYHSSFIGRDLELIELSASLQEGNRLITIVGQGGTGKTRLVNELARQMNDSFQDGAVYFSLAPLESTDYLANYCLDALNISAYAQLKAQEQLMGYLANHEHLLIFDNFEHLTEAAALLTQILEVSPNSKIVITSRETLNLSSETVFELKGLSYPATFTSSQVNASTNIEIYESVQLFLRTARHVNANFSLTQDNEAAVLNICHLLEGSPLTIELAAGWSRLLNPQEIEVELDQNLDMLESTWSDLPERHRSGRGVFEHSWNLLNPTEQNLLKKLSVFRGGFSKGAAQEVAGANLRTLLALLNKSLLTRNSEGRFLRHVLVQQYSAEKLALDKDTEQKTKQAHLDYCQSLFEDLPNILSHSEQLKYIDRLELEHINLRSALDWQLSQTTETSFAASLSFCNSLSFFWDRQCYFDEASTYLEKTLKKTKAQSASHENKSYQSVYAQVLTHKAYFAHIQADFNKAETSAQQALEIFKTLENNAGQSDACYVLSIINHSQSNFLKAKEHCHKSEQLASSMQDPYREARAKSRLGGIYERLDQPTTAYQYSQEALHQFKKLDNLKGISDCLYYMGALSFFNNDFEKADSLLSECASIAESIGYKMRLADAKNNLGNIYREQGKFHEAQPFYIESLTITRSIGDTVGVSFAYDNLGLIIREQGQPAEGKRYIQEALTLRHGFQDTWGMASCIHRLAGIAVAQDNPELAVVLWGVSERLWEEISSAKPKSYLKRFERDWNMAKQQLHDLVFQEAFEKGQAMALEEAVELALRPDFGTEQKELR